jgi:enoyl-CoA hydratase/carnithine racemase
MGAPAADEEIELSGVLLRSRSSVRQIVLNEPRRRNPMSPAIMQGLIAACDRIDADPDARVVILTGAGSAFSAGGDFDHNKANLQGPPERQHAFLANLYKPFLRILDLPMPTIAAINGPAVGGGFAIAMLCDIRVIADEARLVTSFASMGFAPGLGLTYSLERAVGLSKAAELLYSGDILTGKDADAMGLARSVPRAKLDDCVRVLADKIAANSPTVNRMVKGAMFTAYRTELKQRLERDILAQVVTSLGSDYRDYLANIDARTGKAGT